MVKQLLKIKAEKLRKAGYSYNYIKNKIKVSKGTLSDWLQEIEYKPNPYTVKKIGKARIMAGEYKHKIKIQSLENAKTQAKKDIGVMSKRDIMMLGLGLYIGEGGKTAGLTRIINSDPKVIKLALKWLLVSFGVQVKNIKIRLYLYPDNSEKDCISYWSKQIKIPENQFFKSMVDKRTNKKTYNVGKLPYGTAHLSVKSFGDKKLGIYLHRLIMALINEVLC